jgi:hypothetical protein
VFPSWEDEDDSAGRVASAGVGDGDGVLHGAANAFMVVFRVSDVSAVPCVVCVAAPG